MHRAGHHSSTAGPRRARVRRWHAVRRWSALLTVCGAAVLSLSGCLRVHAALAVSSDDLVSGDLVVATVPVSSTDDGPDLTIPPELSDKVTAEPYSADDYVGQRLTFTDLHFADVAVVVEQVSTVRNYRMSFRRSGQLVSMTGSIDLTRVPKQRADIQIKIAFPGTIVRTNGTDDHGTITWEPKPGAVTELTATARFSGDSGLSWYRWVMIVGGGAFGVALIVAVLALVAHRRSVRAERAAAAGPAQRS